MDDLGTVSSEVNDQPARKLKKEDRLAKVPAGVDAEHHLTVFDESCVFVSRGRQVTDSPGMKEHTIELRHPCKGCPEGTHEKSPHELVAKGTLYVVSRGFVEKCVRAIDYGKLTEMFDEYSQSTHDWMQYCTKLNGPDGKLGEARVGLDQFVSGSYISKLMSMTATEEDHVKVAAFVKRHGVYQGYPSRPGVNEMKGCVLVDDLCLTQKKWAGQGHGAFLLNTALKKLMPAGSIGPVYLKVFPLQWSLGHGESCWRQVYTGEDPAGLNDDFTEDQKEKLKHDTHELINYYKKCGFVYRPSRDPVDDDATYLVRGAVWPPTDFAGLSNLTRAAPCPSVTFPVGSVIRTVGLQQRLELNGQLGRVVECAGARGRWKVQMRDGSLKMIKTENLWRQTPTVREAKASTSASGTPATPAKAVKRERAREDPTVKEKTQVNVKPAGNAGSDVVSVEPDNLHILEAQATEVFSSPLRTGPQQELQKTPNKKRRCHWKPEEADKLRNAIEQHRRDWARISKVDGLERFTTQQLIDKSKSMQKQTAR